MIRSIALLLAALTLGCHSARYAELLPPADQTRADVYWLADDAREGRLPGTPGNEQAARYVADRFAALGLKPAPGMRSYRQPFEAPGPRAAGPKTALSIGGRPLTLDTDFRPIGFSKSGGFEGSAAFIGYGITNAAKGYDDFAGVDVKGRIALAMRFEPHGRDGKSAFTGGEPSAAAPVNAKARAAKAAGAVALLLVMPPAHHGQAPPLIPLAAAPYYGETEIPVVTVTAAVAESLLGAPLAEVQQQIDSSLRPQSRVLDVRVRGVVDLQTRPIPTANVMAVLPGTGPTKDEYLVVGAHYDHIGHGLFGSLLPGSGRIHNGADDNASGTAAVLSLAQRLKMQPLRRSVLFVTFSAEESGLIGSNYLVKHLPVPAAKVVAMINLDMVGRVRNDLLFVGGGGTRPGFRRMLQRADQDSPLQLKSIGEGGFGPSDHQAFAMAKVPVLFFFSGTHAQYHHPDDDAQLINYTGLDQVCRLMIDVMRQIDAAGREAYVSKYDSADFFRNPHATTRPTTGPATGPSTQAAQNTSGMGNASLGVVPDYGSDLSTGGVRISGARPNSAAEQAGLREGDILVGFDGKPINNLYDLSDCLKQSSPGDTVEIAYERGGQRTTVRVRLTARTGIQ